MLHKISKKALIDEHKILIMGVVGEGDIECHNVMFYDLDNIPSGVPKLEDGKIVPATLEDLYKWGMITIDDIRDTIRLERTEVFKTLLIYDVAVLTGEQAQSDEQKRIRDNYRKMWLDFPDRITPENAFVISPPEMPEFISYYKQFK